MTPKNETTKTTNTNEKRSDISRKYLLTLKEARDYTGIGCEKLRQISNSDNCDFVLWNGEKRMFKREKLEKFLDSCFSI